MIPLKEGDRIELIEMPKDPCPVPPGTRGTVVWIGPEFEGDPQYGVKWDNGRTLNLVPIDVWKKVT